MIRQYRQTHLNNSSKLNTSQNFLTPEKLIYYCMLNFFEAMSWIRVKFFALVRINIVQDCPWNCDLNVWNKN